MSDSQQYRIILVGATPLLFRCYLFLRDKGQHVTSIYTNESPGMHLSTESTEVHLLDEVTRILTREPCDYLFSIANERVLPSEILAWPRKLAINYHDSLLPAFAGRNAPAWSIFQKSKTHGITWHVMEDRVDTGDILVQQAIDVKSDITTSQLNVQCFDAAFSGFQQLWHQLETQSLTRIPQPDKGRSFFSSTRMLPHGGVVDWSQSAEEIDVAIRAADFGGAYWEIGKVKFQYDGEWHVIGAATIVDMPSTDVAPGTLVFRDKAIHVATGSKWLKLDRIQKTDGTPVVFKKDSRSNVSLLAAADTHALKKFYRRSSRLNRYWFKRFEQQRFTNVLTSDFFSGKGQDCDFSNISLSLCDGVTVTEQAEDMIFRMSTLAAIVVLWRIGDFREVTVWIHVSAPSGVTPMARALCQTLFPLTLSIDETSTFESLWTDFHQQWERILEQRPVAGEMLWANGPRKTQGSMVINLSDEMYSPAQKGQLVISPGKNFLNILFDDAVFSENECTRFGELVVRLVSSWFKQPTQAVYRLNLLTTEEEKWQVVNPEYYPAGAEFVSIFTLFLTAAERNPQHVAVHDESETLSYHELMEIVKKMTAYLTRHGVHKGDVVAVDTHREVRQVAAILSVLACGAIYLPLDGTQPEERRNAILRDAGAKYVIVSDNSREFAFHFAIPVFSLSTMSASSESISVADHSVSATDTAYVIFTSGSTGTPKGTMVSHGAISYFIRQDIAQYGITGDDRILQLCSLSFDASVEEIFSALCSGGGLYLRPDDLLRSMSNLFDYCDCHRLTIIGLFPAHIKAVVDEIQGGRALPSSIRLITTGGEAVQKKDVQQWQQLFASRSAPSPRFINVYGLTETTIASVICDMTNHPLQSDTVPIGRPIQGTVVHILDQRLQPVPTGIVGEICIGGSGIADGYIGCPEATAASFVNDPFFSSKKMFKTGDYGRFLPNGEIEFLGRRDHQIKFSGFRIETEEILSEVEKIPHVHKAALVFRSATAEKSARLVAFLIHEKKIHQTASLVSVEEKSAIIKKLSGTLPTYMVPLQYVWVPEFPLDNSGKVNQKELLSAADRLLRESHPLSDDIFEIVRNIWMELLPDFSGNENDHFFEVGGSSLSAVELIIRVEALTHKKITMEDVFEYPTVSSLCRYLSAVKETSCPGHGFVHLSENVISKISVVIDTSQLPRSLESPLSVVGNSHGKQKPLFWCFNDMKLEPSTLATHLGPDQPLYGFFSGGRLFDDESYIPSYAQQLADEIESIDDSGSYRLGGNCLGAQVMVETAKELLRRKRRITGLCLMEYFEADLYTLDVPLQLLFGRESTLEMHRKFRWQESEWETPFVRLPRVYWIPGGHGQFFQPGNAEVLANRIAVFFDMNIPRSRTTAQSRAIICTGFHRSATSSFAHYLHDAGLHMGNDLMLGTINNVKGHYEDWDVVNMHDKQLKCSRATWHFHDECTLYSNESDFKDYIDTRFSTHSMWGIKDPRASLFLPQWSRTLGERGRYVFLIRHWSSCVESLLNRHSQRLAYCMGSRPEQNINLRFWREPTLAAEMWLSYNERILYHIEHHRSQTMVVTQRALFHHAPVLETMNEQFGLHLDVNISPPFESGLLRDFAYEHNREFYSASFLERLESLWTRLLAHADFRYTDESPRWICFPSEKNMEIDFGSPRGESSRSPEESVRFEQPARMQPYIHFLSNDPKSAAEQLKKAASSSFDAFQLQQLMMQVDTKFSKRPRVLIELAKALIRASAYKEAIPYLERVLSLQLKQAQVDMLLGQCYEGMGNFRKAKSCYDDAINGNGSNPQFFLHRGALLGKQGNTPDADRDFEQARKLGLSHPPQYIMYCDHLRRTGRLREARELAVKLAEESNSPQYIDNLAAIEMQIDFAAGKKAYLSHLYKLHQEKDHKDWLNKICRRIASESSSEDFRRRCMKHWQTILSAK